MGRLQGKAAVITGAASGIGRASAALFAAEGAKVIAVDLAGEVVDTVKEISDAGGTAIAVEANAADEGSVADIMALCNSEYGSVDAVYANAGIVGEYGHIEEQTVDGWIKTLTVNLIGPMLAIKHATPFMREQGGGSIICTASVAGLKANAGPLAYSASKAGVVSLVQTAANDLFDSGVRVNAICPGLIETGMTRFIYEKARERGSEHKIGQHNALNRGGEPIEIAKMALFLASDDASYVNGHAHPVDGGLTSTHPFIIPKF